MTDQHAESVDDEDPPSERAPEDDDSPGRHIDDESGDIPEPNEPG